jgi:hypothetical protein
MAVEIDRRHRQDWRRARDCHASGRTDGGREYQDQGKDEASHRSIPDSEPAVATGATVLILSATTTAAAVSNYGVAAYVGIPSRATAAVTARSATAAIAVAGER